MSFRLCRFRERSGDDGLIGVRADVADRGVPAAGVVAVGPPEHGPVGGGLVGERGEVFIVAGDNPERIRSEAAFAKLAGISPVPTGSGMTSGRHRINRGGHRQLNAAIYRTVIVRMQFHQPTIAYVVRRTAEGKSKRDIIRCLKRYVIREVYHLIKTNPRTGEIAT